MEKELCIRCNKPTPYDQSAPIVLPLSAWEKHSTQKREKGRNQQSTTYYVTVKQAFDPTKSGKGVNAPG